MSEYPGEVSQEADHHLTADRRVEALMLWKGLLALAVVVVLVVLRARFWL